MDLRGMVDRQEAGLAHFAKANCRIAVVETGELRKLQRFDQADATAGPVVASRSIWLRSTWGVEGLARFSFSFDGSAFTELGNPCRLSWGAYRGDRVGLYTSNSAMDRGYVDFSDFRYRIQ
jgi:hypothetical protein